MDGRRRWDGTEITSGGQTNRGLAASGTTAVRRTGTKFLTAIAAQGKTRQSRLDSRQAECTGSVTSSQVHPDTQTLLSIGHIAQRDRSHPV